MIGRIFLPIYSAGIVLATPSASAMSLADVLLTCWRLKVSLSSSISCWNLGTLSSICWSMLRPTELSRSVWKSASILPSLPSLARSLAICMTLLKKILRALTIPPMAPSLSFECAFQKLATAKSENASTICWSDISAALLALVILFPVSNWYWKI